MPSVRSNCPSYRIFMLEFCWVPILGSGFTRSRKCRQEYVAYLETKNGATLRKHNNIFHHVLHFQTFSDDSTRSLSNLHLPRLMAKPREKPQNGPCPRGGTQVADFSKGKIRGSFPNIFAPPRKKSCGESYTKIWILNGGYRGLGAPPVPPL